MYLFTHIIWFMPKQVHYVDILVIDSNGFVDFKDRLSYSIQKIFKQNTWYVQENSKINWCLISCTVSLFIYKMDTIQF